MKGLAVVLALLCLNVRQDPTEKVATLIRQLGADEFEARESATKALTRLGSKAKSPLEAARQSSDPEIRNRATAILEELVLAEKLAAWGDGEPAFWAVLWDLSRSDAPRLALLLEAAFPEEKARNAIRKRQEAIAPALKVLLEEFNEIIASDHDRERFEAIEKAVRSVGVALLPQLRLILDYDMNAAFTQSDEGSSTDVVRRKISARDQVKALYAAAWIGRKELLGSVARHLESPSLTARSRALETLELLTGKKLAREKAFLYGDEDIGEAQKWWQAHRESYLKPKAERK